MKKSGWPTNRELRTAHKIIRRAILDINKMGLNLFIAVCPEGEPEDVSWVVIKKYQKKDIDFWPKLRGSKCAKKL